MSVRPTDPPPPRSPINEAAEVLMDHQFCRLQCRSSRPGTASTLSQIAIARLDSWRCVIGWNAPLRSRQNTHMKLNEVIHYSITCDQVTGLTLYPHYGKRAETRKPNYGAVIG